VRERKRERERFWNQRGRDLGSLEKKGFWVYFVSQPTKEKKKNFWRRKLGYFRKDLFPH